MCPFFGGGNDTSEQEHIDVNGQDVTDEELRMETVNYLKKALADIDSGAYWLSSTDITDLAREKMILQNLDLTMSTPNLAYHPTDNPHVRQFVEHSPFELLTEGFQESPIRPQEVQGLEVSEQWKGVIANTSRGRGCHWVLILFRGVKALVIDDPLRPIYPRSALKIEVDKKFTQVNTLYTGNQVDGWLVLWIAGAATCSPVLPG